MSDINRSRVKANGSAVVAELGGWAASQLEACTRCGICAAACPFYAATGNPEYAPVYKLELLRRAYEQEHTLVGKLKLAMKIDRPVSKETAERWGLLNFGGCSTCSRCSQACPMGIDIAGLLHKAREHLAELGVQPEGLVLMAQGVAKQGNVFDFPAYERAGWVEYMADAPDDLYQRPQAQVVYFVGCVSSFSPRAQRIAEANVHVLEAAGVDFTILGEGEVCCGFPLRRAGRIEEAEKLVQQNVAAVQATGAKMVVFNCPACRLVFMESYAEHLPGVELLHITELFARLAGEGKLPLVAMDTNVTYHDPCDLARTGGVYEAPRRSLQAIPGLKLHEVAERRRSGLCCGGGANVEAVDPDALKGVARQALVPLSASGSEILATACPQCVRAFEEGLKQIRPEMKVMDVAEVIERALNRAKE